jgi:MFS family permease
MLLALGLSVRSPNLIILLPKALLGSGTTLCSFATSMEALIAARVIAGMGGGGSVILSHNRINAADQIPYLA